MNEIIAKYSKTLIDLIFSEEVRFSPSMGENLPRAAGVYRIFKLEEGQKASMFVGKSVDLRRRVHNNHHIGSRDVSILRTKLLRQNSFRNELQVTKFFHRSCAVQYILIPDTRYRNLFEHFAIAILEPEFND
jgi:excinuclease UvrABC nuclease subunit